MSSSSIAENRSSTHEAVPRERFLVRSRILRDLSISASAKVLFLLLDDESWGEDGLSMKQDVLAKILGVTDRQIRRLVGELEKHYYIRVEHRISGNVYDFYRTKMSGMERTKMSARTGQKCPPLLISKKQQEPPLTPQGGKCIKCRGRGRSGRCSECGGSGIRIVAPIVSGEWATAAELGL